MPKLVKFGGSSLADANQFKKVADIIKSDKHRRFVVPSAPGKRFGADNKVTDMLYGCYEAVCGGSDPQTEFKPVAERFNKIISDLGLSIDLSKEYEIICDNFKKKAGRDYAASRGEYLNGIILAEFLDFNFVDAAEVILFDSYGNFDADLTDSTLSLKLGTLKNAVIPGFYGAMPDGSIKTFSRGGSDFTGAVAAKAISASVYENWTDVSGVLVADPKIVLNPVVIERLTYRELRELSYMGATVLHEDCIFPVRSAKIPINIKNTNDPSAAGTMIVPESTEISDPPYIITGIAGKLGFSTINIEKDEMNSEIGFFRRILTLLETEKVSFEHLPTGIDTMTIVISDENLKKSPRLIEKIEKVAKPNNMDVEDGLALIAIVGRGMKNKKGTAARIFAALSHADINIRIIDQGSSELNIIIGLDGDDFEQAINVIYDMFILS
ncbi:MAG: aspartate kinase [Eubacterium sp.]|jgi:aspartate kinase|nr:aspartate kinase [Eubacterium sp.]